MWIYNETCNSFSKIAMIFAAKLTDSEVSQIIHVRWRFTSRHFTAVTYLIIIEILRDLTSFKLKTECINTQKSTEMGWDGSRVYIKS